MTTKKTTETSPDDTAYDTNYGTDEPEPMFLVTGAHPIPARTKGHVPDFPFAHMKPGDSFGLTKEFIGKARIVVAETHKTEPHGPRFTIRAVQEPDGIIYRCWRVK